MRLTGRRQDFRGNRNQADPTHPVTEHAQRRSAAEGFDMWMILLHVQLGKDPMGFVSLY